MIKNIKNYDFNKLYELLRKSFPRDEYRSFEGQKALLKDESYGLVGELGENGELKGFIAFFELTEVVFIEHFVVDAMYRNLGIGQGILKEFCNRQKKTVLLEVELPDSEINRRRIDFYKRNGFHYNDYQYMQPPIEKGRNSIPLKLMTYPKSVIDEREFLTYKNYLYQYVYHMSDLNERRGDVFYSLK